MPIRNNVELFNFFKITGMKYYTSEDISNYVKVSEVELEINNFSYVIDNNTMYKMCGIENIKAFVTKSFEILSKDDKDRFASTFYLDFCKDYINQIGLKNMTKNDSHLCALISEIDQVGRHGLRSFRLINHYDEAKEGLIVFKAFLELIKNSDVKLALPELFKDIEPSEINEFIESDSIQKYTEKYIETKVVPYKVTELTQKWSHVKEIFGNLAKMIECSKLNELKFENELGLTVDFHGN
jgi:hypothetical protein